MIPTSVWTRHSVWYKIGVLWANIKQSCPFVSKQIWIRSFKWDTVHSCRSRGCKNIWGQSSRLIKNLPVQPAQVASSSRLAELAIFFGTSNFDLKYFCNLLTYKNVQYLIWKIWVISHLIEAQGLIQRQMGVSFFAAVVWMISFYWPTQVTSKIRSISYQDSFQIFPH